MLSKYHILISIFIALSLTVKGSDSFIQESEHPISAALQNLLATGNIEEAADAVKGFSVPELAALPDSILFDYYYLKAFVKDSEGNEKSKRNYLMAAKDLCEKFLGIHTPVYLELCHAIGDSFEKTGDRLSAFEIYQAVNDIIVKNFRGYKIYIMYPKLDSNEFTSRFIGETRGVDVVLIKKGVKDLLIDDIMFS